MFRSFLRSLASSFRHSRCDVYASDLSLYVSHANNRVKQEVKQYKEEWDAVMEKLADIAGIVIDVGQSCQAHGLVEQDLPDGIRNILKSLHRYVHMHIARFRYMTRISDLGGIEGALKQCTETRSMRAVLMRSDMLQRVRKYDAKLSSALQSFQVCPSSPFIGYNSISVGQTAFRYSPRTNCREA